MYARVMHDNPAAVADGLGRPGRVGRGVGPWGAAVASRFSELVSELVK